MSEYLDSHHLAIAGVDGGRAAAVARQCGGMVPVSFQKDVPWRWGLAGRNEPLNLIVLDMSMLPHEQAAVFLHELGHTDYRERVLRREWVDAEAELHAQRFAIEQMLARGLTASLQFLVRQVAKSQEPGFATAECYAEANARLMGTELWRQAKERASTGHARGVEIGMKRVNGRLCRNDVDLTGTLAIFYEPRDDGQIIGATSVPDACAPFDAEPYTLRFDDGATATVFVASDQIHPVSKARKLGFVGRLDGSDAKRGQ